MEKIAKSKFALNKLFAEELMRGKTYEEIKWRFQRAKEEDRYGKIV